MTKQVMTILSAKDKKIKTLYPEKVVARKALLEAEMTPPNDDPSAGMATSPDKKAPDNSAMKEKDVQQLKLNRKTRRYLQKRTRQHRKAEARVNAQPFRYTDDNFKFKGPKKLKEMQNASKLD